MAKYNKGEIVKISNKFYKIEEFISSLYLHKPLYSVIPLKPSKGIDKWLDRTVASEDEFQQLTEAEKVLYG